MIRRIRSPFHAPRDVDMGPGWAASATRSTAYALTIGNMDPPKVIGVGQLAITSNPALALPSDGKRCRRNHLQGGLNTSSRGECLICRAIRNRTKSLRVPSGETCGRGHPRATFTDRWGRCRECRRERENVKRPRVAV